MDSSPFRTVIKKKEVISSSNKIAPNPYIKFSISPMNLINKYIILLPLKL